jgi:hypothetical protein
MVAAVLTILASTLLGVLDKLNEGRGYLCSRALVNADALARSLLLLLLALFRRFPRRRHVAAVGRVVCPLLRRR